MKDLVIVKSKTINNESIPVIINVAEVKHGKIMDQREISRSYVFEDFETTIPLRYAKILIKQQPNEFRIDRAVDKDASKTVLSAIKTSKIRSTGLVCKICGKKDIKSKAGLTSHIRYNHPKEFAEMYPSKVKAKEAKKAKVIVEKKEPKNKKKVDTTDKIAEVIKTK